MKKLAILLYWPTAPQRDGPSQESSGTVSTDSTKPTFPVDIQQECNFFRQ